MPKQYQWSTRTDYSSDTPLSWGVIPNDTSWHTENAGSGSATASYYFRDSNTPPYTDPISSRVITSVTNSWTTSIDNNNVLTINLQTTINSIARDDVRGSDYATPGRVIDVYNSNGAKIFGPYTDTSINTAHSISGVISVGATTIILQPGEDAALSALRIHNQTVGMASYDDIGVGVRFRNILPADYRPGKVLDNNGVWQSHDRSAGMSKIRGTNGWIEMRTVGGGEYSDNPPLIRHTSGWKNMRKIGNDS